MRRRSLSIVLLIVVAALVAPNLAASKEIVTTACGRDRCRTVVGAVSGIAVRPTRVQAPSRGRFYTLSVRITVDGTAHALESRLRSQTPSRRRRQRGHPLLPRKPAQDRLVPRRRLDGEALRPGLRSLGELRHKIACSTLMVATLVWQKRS